MSLSVLDRVAREASGRIVGALAARFRDLDIAEDAFGDACVKAAEAWPKYGIPFDPDGWLYRTAERKALDALRRRRTRERLVAELPTSELTPSPEEALIDDARVIPDERLRLIFVCCHPALAPDSRVAKRKISDAGIPFEVPGPQGWSERLEAVLSTLEIAYAKSHEDAACLGVHAPYASEVLELTRILVEMVPSESEALALAALVRYTEARRPARLDDQGVIVQLSEQDPALWLSPLIEEADSYLKRAWMLGSPGARTIQAAIHGTWCWRKSLQEVAPWPQILDLYDALLVHRDDSVIRVNRAVALAQVAGTEVALKELATLASQEMDEFLPYHVLLADLLRQSGRWAEARVAYGAALALGPGPAERLWLDRRKRELSEH